jgi:hypothetical protein
MRVKRILSIGAFLMVACTALSAQRPAASSPGGLVKDLYRVHNQKRGPFFQRRSRGLVDKYFAKSLADLIWKDAHGPKGEVGVIDGDPLYDAQDMEIKKFAIGETVSESATKAKVPVTFENFGEKKTITFMLTKGAPGWRINDVDYGGGRTLAGQFKAGR